MERTTCLQIGSDNFTVTIITLYFIPPSFVQNHFFSPKPKSCFENFFSGFDNDYNPRLFRPFIPFSRPPPSPLSSSHSSSQIIFLLTRAHNGTFFPFQCFETALSTHLFSTSLHTSSTVKSTYAQLNPNLNSKHYAYLRYPARYTQAPFHKDCFIGSSRFLIHGVPKPRKEEGSRRMASSDFGIRL